MSYRSRKPMEYTLFKVTDGEHLYPLRVISAIPAVATIAAEILLFLPQLQLTPRKSTRDNQSHAFASSCSLLTLTVSWASYPRPANSSVWMYWTVRTARKIHKRRQSCDGRLPNSTFTTSSFSCACRSCSNLSSIYPVQSIPITCYTRIYWKTA